MQPQPRAPTAAWISTGAPLLRQTRRALAQAPRRVSVPTARRAGVRMAADTRGVNGTAPLYAALVGAQAVPFVFPNAGFAGDVAYFTTTAVAALIIGCKRAPLEPASLAAPISKQQALVAPFAASAFLFGSYLLLKYTHLDIGIVFNFLTTFAGSVCLKEALDPVAYSVLSLFGLQDVAFTPARKSAREDAPSDGSEPGDYNTIPEPPTLTLASGISTIVAVAVTAGYLLHVEPTFVFSNAIALGICARVLSIVRPESFIVAAGLLTGLFFYDIFWVFGSEVMVSVATQIDSPGKLLFPRDIADSSIKYPYAILGLGDVCVPGIFASLALALDLTLVQKRPPGIRAPAVSGPYFSAAVAAYAAGLLSCFVVNLTTHNAQPALLYLVPALILSSVATGAARGELSDVVSFRMPSIGGDRPSSEIKNDEVHKE